MKTPLKAKRSAPTDLFAGLETSMYKIDPIAPAGNVEITAEKQRHLNHAAELLLAKPHGPGQVGFAFFVLNACYVAWVHYDRAAEILLTLDANPTWIGKARALPDFILPTVFVLPNEDTFFGVVPYFAPPSLGGLS